MSNNDVKQLSVNAKHWNKPPSALVDAIIEQEAKRAGIRPSLILSEDRRAAVSWARANCCKRLRNIGAYSTTAIGEALNLDHSSVSLAIRKRQSATPPAFKERAKPRQKELLGDFEVNPRVEMLSSQRLLKFLENAPVWTITVAEAAAVLMISNGAAQSALKGLLDKGKVARIKRGHYRVLTKTAKPERTIIISNPQFGAIRPIPMSRLMGGKA